MYYYYFKVLSNKRKVNLVVGGVILKGLAEVMTFTHFAAAVIYYLTGLKRLLDISHEHKFPGNYCATSHLLLKPHFFFSSLLLYTTNNLRFVLDIVVTKPVTLFIMYIAI